jgi:CRP-like cAMP-binding protein/Zn-dependent protease
VSALRQRAGLWGRLADHIESAEEDTEQAGVWDALASRIDPAAFRPRLAADIEVREFKLKWGNDYVMIANPRDLVHYRLSPEDAALLPLMDGTRTVKEIVVERFRDSGDLELSGVIDLVRLLQEENFLDQRFTNVEAAVKRAVSPDRGLGARARKFATTLRVDWTGAERVVRFLYRAGFKWFFDMRVTTGAALVAATGFVAFLSDVRSKNFSLSGESLAIGFLILIFLDYFSVFLHELGHALVLVHNKRRVKSAGFLIYFGSPAFFVEASESLMLDRSQSIIGSFAGPFAQMIVGGICSIVAWAWPGWILSETLYRTAVLNYWMVFVNLLPMLELDGYYILSDAIQVPDLRPRSLTFIQHDLWHKLRTRERFTKQEGGLAAYGILGVAFTGLSFVSASFYWRTVFGSLVSRMWRAGVATRALLVVLGLFVASPLVRGAVNLFRSLGRKLRLVARRIRFRLEQSWRVEAAELIDALPLFDDVPEEFLNDLAGRVRLRSLSGGQAVVRQGDRASAFYVVRRGTLEVVEEDPETGNERTLRVLGRGEAFGELGLKESGRRSATVRALDEAQVFEIDKSTFDRLLADMVSVPEFEPTLQEIVELRQLPCFARLEPDELAELRQRGRWVNVSPGETVVEQGEAADAFYAIGSGQVQVYEDGQLVGTLGPGSYFGEIGLLLDVPRTATVVALTAVRAYRLDRGGFDGLVRDSFAKGTLNPAAGVGRVSEH